MSARPAGESTPRGRSKRPSRARRWRIGVISDTHGLLRPEAVSALEGSDLIVMYLNPGSAGPRRFSLPVSVARLEVRGAELQSELLELSV
jgi:predicted phosphodiesterase